MIDSNKPKVLPKDDDLGYEKFAQDCANDLVKMIPSDGFVLSITGPWGCGKTTVINFIDYYLSAENTELKFEKNEIPLVLHFNPWMFSGQKDITIQFFSQIKSEFPKSKNFNFLFQYIDQEITNNLNSIFIKLTELAIATNVATLDTFKFLLPLTQISINAIKIKSVYDQKKEKSLSNSNVLELKEEIKSLLINLKFKIVIIIDDFDRLTPDEIQQMFRAIKAIADFPNVTYLLAYDESVVIDALNLLFTSERDSPNIPNKGREYLEKIVQLSIPVPTPEKFSLNAHFESELLKILGGTDENYFDRKHWTFSYYNGVSNFFTTPRKTKMLINSLKFFYPRVKNEVNAVDFILIDCLRIFKPELYQYIRQHTEFFINGPVNQAFAGGINEASFIEFHEKWIARIPSHERKTIERIVSNLFPDMGKFFEKRRGQNEEIVLFNESRLLSQGRMCSNEDTYSKFFRFMLEPDDVSLKSLKYELAAHSHQEYYSNKFRTLIKEKTDTGRTKAFDYLLKLFEYVDESSPKDALIAIISSFFDVGDELLVECDDKTEGLITRTNHFYIIETAMKGLYLLKDDRLKILEDGIDNGKSISFMSSVLIELGQQQGKFGGYKPYVAFQPLIDRNQYDQLENKYLKKIRTITKKDFDIFYSPNLKEIIFLWNQLTQDTDEVKQYVREFVSNKPVFTNAIINVGSSNYWKRFNRYCLLPYYTEEQITQIIDEIFQSDRLNWSPSQIAAFENFKKGK